MTAAQRKFITYLKKHKPKSVEDLRPTYHPRFIAEDAFRQAFDVRTADKTSLELVIKFPASLLREGPQESIEHTQDEMAAICRFSRVKRYLALRRYLPKVLYYDGTNGVIVMPKYKPVQFTKRFEAFLNTFDCMLYDLATNRRFEFDSGPGNFGLTARHEYVLLDAGLLGDLER